VGSSEEEKKGSSGGIGMVDIEKKEEYELDMREKDLKAPSSPKLKHRRKEEKTHPYERFHRQDPF
jgi:hypothetical protein